MQVRGVLAHVARTAHVAPDDPGIPLAQVKSSLGLQVRVAHVTHVACTPGTADGHICAVRRQPAYLTHKAACCQLTCPHWAGGLGAMACQDFCLNVLPMCCECVLNVFSMCCQ